MTYTPMNQLGEFAGIWEHTESLCKYCHNQAYGDLICPDCLREISGYDESEECDDSTDSD